MSKSTAKSALKVGFTYNQKRIQPGLEPGTDVEAEFDSPKTLNAIRSAIRELGYEVIDLEASPQLPRLISETPVDVVFNIAEGLRGRNRETQVPAILELLGIPYTGSDPTTLALTLDKGIAKRVVSTQGIPTAPFFVISHAKETIPGHLKYPLVLKPLAEGSSKGVHSSGVVHSEKELREKVQVLIQRHHQPVLIEEFLSGREFTVGILGSPERPKVLPPMEIVFAPSLGDFPVYAYEHKLEENPYIRYDVHPKLDPGLLKKIEDVAARSYTALGCRDVGRIDLRMDQAGNVCFLECNPLPGLTPGWSDLCLIADGAGISYQKLIADILKPAVSRYRKQKRDQLHKNWTPPVDPLVAPGRCRAREIEGISFGRFKTGALNSITDVQGVRVGHSTIIESSDEQHPIRTGVTAILPNHTYGYQEPVTAGSFVLNGAGEMSGMIQVQEWGVLETPIILSNTFSVGACADAAVKYLMQKYPEIGRTHDVVIPVVGECDDSWLNDIAGMHIRSEHVHAALKKAISKEGIQQVPEGSVGAGTGMITCDYKSGIGSASRILPPEMGGYTIGCLVLSNFGTREELRVGGYPVGEWLSQKYPKLPRRTRSYGSIIVVLATDAPMSSRQLDRLSKRAALGIGRVGSYAAHGSGEMVIAFSTANKIPRRSSALTFNMKVMLDAAINPIYQAAIEATEEAILNSLFASQDMIGVGDHYIPDLPIHEVREYFKAKI